MKTFLALKHKTLPDTFGHVILTQDKIFTTPIPYPTTLGNTIDKLKKWYKGTIVEIELNDYELVKINWRL